MTETLSPRIDGRTEPLDERWGLSFGAGATRSVGTSFTEGGMGLDFQLKCDIAESLNELYSPTVKLSLDMTEGKYLPGSGYDPAGDASRVPGYGAKHGSLMLGLGRTQRNILSYRKDARWDLAFRSENTPLLGIGWRRQEQGDQTVDGETYSFENADSKTLDVANSQRWAFETRPSGDRWPTYTLGMDFMLGTEYAGADSRYNRMFLKLGISLTVGLGDAATAAGNNGDTSIGPMGEIYAYQLLAHSLASRILMNETLSKPQSDLNDYLGESGGEDGRGSQANVPLFTAASAFNGAFDGLSPVVLRTDEGTLATIAILRGLSGALFLGSETEAGSVGGGVAVMNALRLGGFALADIHTPAARQAHRSRDGSSVRRREAKLNALNFGANTLLTLLGASGGNISAMKIGASANMPVAGTPDPVQDGLVERTDYRYIMSLSNNGGSRGGLLIHSSWRDIPFYSAVSLVSPSLLPGNTANHVSQDEPYTNIRANSDVDASMGVEWRARSLRTYLGLDTKAIFGGDKDTQAGIGATAGIDLLLASRKSWGVSAGVRATAVKLLPDGGNQFELIPGFGFTVYQTAPEHRKKSENQDDE